MVLNLTSTAILWVLAIGVFAPCTIGQPVRDVGLRLASQLAVADDTLQSQKAKLEGLDFWIEFDEKGVVAGSSRPVFMVVSNMSDVAHYLDWAHLHSVSDTAIGNFIIVDENSGVEIECQPPRMEREDTTRGFHGENLNPRGIKKFEGYLKTFPLTNPGSYLISARASFPSSNRTGRFELQTPPVAIRLLPSTNGTTEQGRGAVESSAIPMADAITPTKRVITERQSTAHGRNESMPVAAEQQATSDKGRNSRFGLLVFLPVLLAVGWIVWRRRRR